MKDACMPWMGWLREGSSKVPLPMAICINKPKESSTGEESSTGDQCANSPIGTPMPPAGSWPHQFANFFIIAIQVTLNSIIDYLYHHDSHLLPCYPLEHQSQMTILMLQEIISVSQQTCPQKRKPHLPWGFILYFHRGQKHTDMGLFNTASS